MKRKYCIKEYHTDCDYCNGSGKELDQKSECDYCGGTGCDSAAETNFTQYLRD